MVVLGTIAAGANNTTVVCCRRIVATVATLFKSSALTG